MEHYVQHMLTHPTLCPHCRRQLECGLVSPVTLVPTYLTRTRSLLGKKWDGITWSNSLTARSSKQPDLHQSRHHPVQGCRRQLEPLPRLGCRRQLELSVQIVGNLRVHSVPSPTWGVTVGPSPKNPQTVLTRRGTLGTGLRRIRQPLRGKARTARVNTPQR
jgi:hypothetical protein